MIVTTTHTVDGKNISEYLGLVSGCTIVGFAGTSKAIRRGWLAAEEASRSDMEGQAAEMGADAIVGVTIGVHRSGVADYLYVTGTAVKLH